MIVNGLNAKILSAAAEANAFSKPLEFEALKVINPYIISAFEFELTLTLIEASVAPVLSSKEAVVDVVCGKMLFVIIYKPAEFVIEVPATDELEEMSA